MRWLSYHLIILAALLAPARAPAGGLRFVTPIKVTSSAFSPSSISGLIFWIKASAGITQGGGTVSEWDDQSITGANFTQATSGKQPAYTASAINGQPGVDFTGTKCMVNTTDLIGDGTNARTILVVSSFSSNTSGFNFLMSFAGLSAGSGNSPQFGFSGFSGYTNIFFGGKLSGGAFGVVRTTTAFGSAGAYAVTLTYNGSGPGAGNYTWYNSNVAQTTITGDDDTDTNTSNILGANSTACDGSVTGPISEFLVYSRVLNSTELGQLQTYINGLYAL